MMGVLISAIHNSSSKGHTPRHRNKCLSHCFYGRTKLIQKSMLVSIIGLRQYYSEMEGKENYRRGMAVCARKVYGNVKNIIHLGQRPLRFWGPRLQPAKPMGKSGTHSLTHSLTHSEILHCLFTSVLQLEIQLSKWDWDHVYQFSPSTLLYMYVSNQVLEISFGIHRYPFLSSMTCGKR